MESFVQKLNFPTSLTFAPDGSLYVAESGLAFGGAPQGGSVSRINPNGGKQVLVSDLPAPVTGLLWHQDSLIISDGGCPGRITRYMLDSGNSCTILDNLPGFGDYHTNMVALGHDGMLYFSQGAATNSAIIGPDSNDLAWLREINHNADTPGYSIEIAARVATTRDPNGNPVSTGAFAKYGTAHPRGTRLPGRTPCTASLMRCNLDGTGLELVAWGLRNAYGLVFLPDGRLLVTDQGADVRGVRPVWNCPDFLYEVKAGAWYGWPDFFGGVPVNDRCFRSPDGTAQSFVLQNHAELPPPERALIEFDSHACAVKLAVIPEPHCHAGDLLVAQFGDERPMTASTGPRVGRNLVRVSTTDWRIHPIPLPDLQRPLDLAFSPDHQILHVVDFGEFEYTPEKRVTARPESGCIWRIPHPEIEHRNMNTVSFEKDIAPLFRQFRASMIWRLDLTKYEDVKLNATMIWSQIKPGGGMPPPPYPPLTAEQVAHFKSWMDQGFPR